MLGVISDYSCGGEEPQTKQSHMWNECHFFPIKMSTSMATILSSQFKYFYLDCFLQRVRVARKRYLLDARLSTCLCKISPTLVAIEGCNFISPYYPALLCRIRRQDIYAPLTRRGSIDTCVKRLIISNGGSAAYAQMSCNSSNHDVLP